MPNCISEAVGRGHSDAHDSGVVDQQVCAVDPGRRSRAPTQTRQVELFDPRLGADPLRNRGRLVGVAARQHNVGTRGGQRDRRLLAQAAVGAGNDHGPSGLITW